MNYKPMKEQIIYRKVFIRGEEDLPKETGFYIANVKDWGISDRHFLVGDKDYFKGWIEDIDWYLLPVTLPSDKEIKQWIKKDRQSLIDCEVATSGELMERFHGREEGVAWLKSRLTDK